MVLVIIQPEVEMLSPRFTLILTKIYTNFRKRYQKNLASFSPRILLHDN